MDKANDKTKNNELIALKLKPETAVWLRTLINGLQLQEKTPLEVARKILAYKDEIADQLPAEEANGEDK